MQRQILLKSLSRSQWVEAARVETKMLPVTFDMPEWLPDLFMLEITVCRSPAHMCGIIGRRVMALSSGQYKFGRWIDFELWRDRENTFFVAFLQNHCSWCRISVLLSGNIRPPALASRCGVRRCHPLEYFLRRLALSRRPRRLLPTQRRTSARMSRFASSRRPEQLSRIEKPIWIPSLGKN